VRILATVLFLLPTFALAHHHRPPPPAPPPIVEPPIVPPEPTPAPIPPSDHRFEHLFWGAVIIGGVVCIINECWKEKPALDTSFKIRSSVPEK
jgi:hypothetical protein